MNKKLQGLKKKALKAIGQLKKVVAKFKQKNAKAIAAVGTYVQNVVAFSVGIGLVEGLMAPLSVLPLTLVVALGYSLVLPSSKSGVFKFYTRAVTIPLVGYASFIAGYLLLQGAPLTYAITLAVSSSLAIISPSIVAGMYLRLRGR